MSLVFPFFVIENLDPLQSLLFNFLRHDLLQIYLAHLNRHKSTVLVISLGKKWEPLPFYGSLFDLFHDIFLLLILRTICHNETTISKHRGSVPLSDRSHPYAFLLRSLEMIVSACRPLVFLLLLIVIAVSLVLLTQLRR